MTEPVPASSVIIARDLEGAIEIFMLRRSAKSTFVPDVYVFPGGRVDSVDRLPEASVRVAGDTAPLESAYVYAAARETFEEAGLLFATRAVDSSKLGAARSRLLAGTRSFAQTLDDLDTMVDGRAMRYFSRWITPHAEPRRFDARFFVARAPEGQIAEADSFETEDGLWLTPRDALARHRAGSLGLVFPTIKHLERLERFTNVDALLAFAASKSIVPVLPDINENFKILMPPELENAW
ncbi:MAG: NUDIX hydrolase [Candidatus Velthaea sp.]